MLKRALVVLALVLSFTVLSHPAQATSYYDLDGLYLVDGSMKVSAKFPAIFTLALTLTDMEVFSGYFEFWSYGDGTGEFYFWLPLLSEEEPLIEGYYTMVGNKFTVTTDLDLYLSMLNGYGVNAWPTSNSFSGQLNSDGSIKGKFSLGVGVDVQGFSGTLTLSSSFTAYQVFLAPPPSGLSMPRPKPKASAANAKVIAEYVSKFVNLISSKGGLPR